MRIGYLIFGEAKQLLLKDLCGRLIYGVNINVPSKYGDGDDKIYPLDTFWLREIQSGKIYKPYLRSMSSMTEEEKEDWVKASKMKFDMENKFIDAYDAHLSTDWLNANHFDYRGLIPMGLAREASKEMYKI